MSSKPKTIAHNVDIEAVDIPTMYAMPDCEYRDYVSQHGLVYVDHHDVLRSSIADYPLATTREQIDIFIEVLSQLRDRMEPRTNKTA